MLPDRTDTTLSIFFALATLDSGLELFVDISPSVPRCRHCARPWLYLRRLLARSSASTASNAESPPPASFVAPVSKFVPPLGPSSNSLLCSVCFSSACERGLVLKPTPLFTCYGPLLMFACFTKATCRGYFSSTNACIVARLCA